GAGWAPCLAARVDFSRPGIARRGFPLAAVGIRVALRHSRVGSLDIVAPIRIAGAAVGPGVALAETRRGGPWRGRARNREEDEEKGRAQVSEVPENKSTDDSSTRQESDVHVGRARLRAPGRGAMSQGREARLAWSLGRPHTRGAGRARGRKLDPPRLPG